MTALSRSRITLAALTSVLIIAAGAAEGRIVKITIDSTTPVANGELFGTVGAYELLRGTAYGELDPNVRHNSGITDIPLAPKNAAGRVEYKAQFAIHKPVDLSKASGILVYNVPNRGGVAIPYTNGDSSFLWRRGDIVLNSSWQGDQPIASVSGGDLGIDVPIAKCRWLAADQHGGGSLRGARAGSRCESDHRIVGRAGPRPRHHGHDASDAGFVCDGIARGRQDRRGGDSEHAISPSPSCRTPTRSRALRARRSCASRAASTISAAVRAGAPGQGSVHPGRRRSGHARRDFVLPLCGRGRLRHGQSARGRIQYVLDSAIRSRGGWGSTCSTTASTKTRAAAIVFDGMNPNIAGMMGSFNIRFAQPGDIAEMYDPGANGTLWWADYADTVRGRPAWGFLHALHRDQHVPEDHGNLRRGGVLVQPRHRRHHRHARY